MIVSASRRTDLPALYAPWLEARFRAGFCDVANPYNPRQISHVSLRREDVDAIVFWTRHAAPILGFLPWLEAQGHRIVFQYTITGYGKPLEPRTPDVALAVRTLCDLAARLRPGAVVWRYDPILVGTAYPADGHLERFGRIAAALEGAVRRVVISVVTPYRKTRARVGRIHSWGVDLEEAPLAWVGLGELLGSLSAVAAEHGMTMEACAQPALAAFRVPPTRCIDDRVLEEVYGGRWPSAKDPGQRPDCRCLPSRDIGAPDTCTFGCAYCYATRSDEAARQRRERHDPEGVQMVGAKDEEGEKA